MFCGCVMYGRSDKRYCSSTCRRDACRVRERTIRIAGLEFFGREQRESDVEAILIPRLEQEYGPNHRLVRDARRLADKRRDAEFEQLRLTMRHFLESEPD